MSKTEKRKYQYFTEKYKNIFIYFDKIYNNEDFEEYNDFKLVIGKKRVYGSMAGFICKENNKVLNFIDQNVTNEVMYNIFCIKRAINDKRFVKNAKLMESEIDSIKDFGKYENFITHIISNLFTPSFISEIKRYVDKYYKPVADLDPDVKYYEGTTFTNEHFKLLYTISTMVKFIIPLCTHYIFVNSDKNIDVFRFMYTVFNSVFNIVVVDTNCHSLMNKLYQFIDKIVTRTESTNKLLWDVLPSYNKTKESVIDYIMIKLVTSIVPKFNFNQSIISLISVVSRDTVLKFILRMKHPFQTYKINDFDNASEEEDKLAESDIFDLYYRPQDEALTLYKKFFNSSTVDQIMLRNRIEISDAELKFYMKTITVHHFSVVMVTQAFATFFSGANNVRSCKREDFIKLIIILIKKMRMLGIDHIPDYLTAVRTSYSFTRIPNKTLLNTLRNNYAYNDIIDNKYRFVKNIFNVKTNEKDSKNPIKDIITTLIHNNYEYNSFDNKSLNGKSIEKDEEAIITDVLKSFRMLIV